MKIFLSYAKEDGAVVKEFHDHLKALGFDPWMDQEQLLPGHAWEREIDKALKLANVVIVFMSPKSVKKRSFVTREANQAVSNLRYKKPDDIYIIPVLIEACEVPEDISDRAQYIDINSPGARNKIVEAIKRAAEQQGILINQGVDYGVYKITSCTLEETKQGRPGHEISVEYPDFSSAERSEVAKFITETFRSRAIEVLLESRSKPWDQDLSSQPSSEEEFESFRMNGRWDKYSVVSATDNFVSVYYNCAWYGAGAAHSNEFHEGINFSIVDNLVYPFELVDLFTDPLKAAQILSAECRKQLTKEYWIRTGMKLGSDEYFQKSFIECTDAKLENFDVFTITNEKITFYFAPYSIAAYAMGSFVVDVSFYELRDVLQTGDLSPIKLEFLH